MSQIRTALGEGSGWKTTTIQTLIKRLLDKSALSREQRDVFYDSPTVSRRELETARTDEFVRNLPLYRNDQVSSPMLIGLLRPALVL